MNKILKMILLGAEQIAIATVPAAGPASAAARAIIKAASGDEKVEEALKLAAAVIQMLEDLGKDFAEQPDFVIGMYQAKAGVTQMVKAVQAHLNAKR